MGGKTAKQSLKISASCEFTATPSSLKKVLPYEEGTEYDLVKMWKEGFEYKAGGETCTVTDIYEYSNPDKYPTDKKYERGLTDQYKETINESMKGITNWYIAFGNSAVEQPSDLVTYTWVVCGKEKLELAEDKVKVISGERSGSDDKEHIIAEDEYKAWFNIDATGDDTDSKCGETKYYIG